MCCPLYCTLFKTQVSLNMYFFRRANGFLRLKSVIFIFQRRYKVQANLTFLTRVKKRDALKSIPMPVIKLLLYQVPITASFDTANSNNFYFKACLV